jgi:hypothetical protein
MQVLHLLVAAAAFFFCAVAAAAGACLLLMLKPPQRCLLAPFGITKAVETSQHKCAVALCMNSLRVAACCCLLPLLVLLAFDFVGLSLCMCNRSDVLVESKHRNWCVNS